MNLFICILALIAFVAMAKYFNRQDDKRHARRLPPSQRHLVTGPARLTTSSLRR
jgi:hypothetical protein